MVYYGKKHIEESEWFKHKHHFTKRIIKVLHVSLLKLHLKCGVQCRKPTLLSLKRDHRKKTLFGYAGRDYEIYLS